MLSTPCLFVAWTRLCDQRDQLVSIGRCWRVNDVPLVILLPLFGHTVGIRSNGYYYTMTSANDAAEKRRFESRGVPNYGKMDRQHVGLVFVQECLQNDYRDGGQFFYWTKNFSFPRSNLITFQLDEYRLIAPVSFFRQEFSILSVSKWNKRYSSLDQQAYEFWRIIFHLKQKLEIRSG